MTVIDLANECFLLPSTGLLGRGYPSNVKLHKIMPREGDYFQE